MFCSNTDLAKYVIFEDEITVFWEKEWDMPDGVKYSVSLNGEIKETTEKTHFEFTKLNPNTKYTVCIERLNEKLEADKTIFNEVLCTVSAKEKLDVTKPPFNAVADGKTLNTTALQLAFDSCKPNQKVYFPKGIYMTGALNVHSDTEVYLEEGAVLQGSAEVNDYAPKILSRFEGKEMQCYRPLINMGIMDKNGDYNCKNISIRGGGTVSGGGEKLCWAVIESERERLKDFLEANAEYVKTCENNNTIPGRARPRLVSINNCENVVLSNVTFQYGAAWNIHFVYSKNIITYGCTIKSRGVWNGDGWDPDSSEDCYIFNTLFQTHDDCIAIKSGKNPEGNIINRPTRNIYVFDCIGNNGVAIGSELSGGIDGVYSWDCDLSSGEAGYRIKTTRKRGGYVRNLKVKNCKTIEIRIYTGYCCNDDGESSGELTLIENIYFENVSLNGISHDPNSDAIKLVPPIYLQGFEEPERYIKNITLKNITVCTSKEKELPPIRIENVENLNIQNLNYQEV